MAELTVTTRIDPGQLARMGEMLAEIPHGLARAISRAVNKIAITARARLLTMIVAELNLKKSDIRERNIKLRRASLTKLFAILTVLGARIPLKYFGARRTNKGVSYAIKRGQRRTILHAFWQTMKSGHRGVFLRTGDPRPGGFRLTTAERSNKVRARKAGLQSVRPHLPISEPRGPSIPQVIANSEEFLSGAFEQLLGEKLAAELDMQMKVLLDQFEKGRTVAPF